MLIPFYVDPTSPSGLRWKGDVIPKGRIKPHAIAGTFDKTTGYWRVQYNGYRTGCHRIVYWLYNSNEFELTDVTKEIDHIDRNRSNNNISNLRRITKKLNMLNNGAAGVYFHKTSGKWAAVIASTHIGLYNTEDEAKVARQKARQSFFNV